MSEKSKKDDYKYIYRISIGVAVFVVIVLAGLPYFLLTHVPNGTLANAGLFGDMFGGINALFSGLAFVGVITAILLQGKELELQSKELAETREVLKDQKQQLELQHKTLTKQQFENTFFELLRLYSDTVKNIKFSDLGTDYYGQDAFKKTYRFFEPILNKAFREDDDVFEILKVIRQLSLAHTNLAHFHEKLSIYYNTACSVMEFIEWSDFNPAEKDFYANLFRSRFSIEELNYLALNCVSPDGEEMMPLMKKYDMFKHLQESDLIRSKIKLALRKENS